jgi:RNA polymerase sigma factor (sigma-70 family)
MRTNEDLVQEALVIIFEKYKNIDFERGVLPWAYGVLDRVMSGDYRTRIRRENILNSHINEVIKLHNNNESTEQKATSFEMADEIWRALSQLNNKEKEIFKLKLEGFSGDEIQEKLGISRTVMDVSVFRGRKKLRKKLEKRGVI